MQILSLLQPSSDSASPTLVNLHGAHSPHWLQPLGGHLHNSTEPPVVVLQVDGIPVGPEQGRLRLQSLMPFSLAHGPQGPQVGSKGSEVDFSVTGSVVGVNIVEVGISEIVVGVLVVVNVVVDNSVIFVGVSFVVTVKSGGGVTCSSLSML